jgi:uncharacterized protein YoxC
MCFVTLTDFAAFVIAIAIVVIAVFVVTAVVNLNRTMTRLDDTATALREEGIGAFRELRQLIADADAELDKVDLVLDRADQATSAISQTSRRTHEAVQDPLIRGLAVASGTSKVAKGWLLARRSKNRKAAATDLAQAEIGRGK